MCIICTYLKYSYCHQLRMQPSYTQVYIIQPQQRRKSCSLWHDGPWGHYVHEIHQTRKDKYSVILRMESENPNSEKQNQFDWCQTETPFGAKYGWRWSEVQTSIKKISMFWRGNIYNTVTIANNPVWCVWKRDLTKEITEDKKCVTTWGDDDN